MVAQRVKFEGSKVSEAKCSVSGRWLLMEGRQFRSESEGTY
jgi:hypothetical protein